MKRFAVLMLLAIGVPTAASALEFSVGRDGIEVGQSRRHGYYRDRDNCRELRAACTHKEQLGEEGQGNCRRYRKLCH